MGSLDKGWVRLNRSIMDNWLWKEKPFSKACAWIDLLLSANHEDKKVLFDGNLVTVKRGQQLTSIRKLSERWGWNRRTTRKFLLMLENDGMVHVECTTRCTTVTLINYGKYQDRGTSKRTTEYPLSAPQSAPQSAHKQEDKRMIKNDKENGLPSGEEAVGIDIPDEEWKEV